MLEKHSAVCYIFERSSGYRPEKKAHTVKNDMGLDLFRFNNRLYEGQTGLQMGRILPVCENLGGREKVIFSAKDRRYSLHEYSKLQNEK